MIGQVQADARLFHFGVTIVCGAKHTLRDEAASEAVLSIHTEARPESRNAFTMPLLRLKYENALAIVPLSSLNV